MVNGEARTAAARRPTARALLAALLSLGVSAGCADPPSGAGRTPVPAPAARPTGAAADTASACGRLLNINFAGRRAFEAQWSKVLAAVAAGDEAAGAKAGEAARRELLSWAAALDGLAVDAADPALRRAVVESSALLTRLAADEDRTPVDRVLPRLGEIDRAYASVCGPGETGPGETGRG
ncbi:MAG TPA: hypothetical protein VNV66_09485 [Pilimelia sp.]|nr:hypothetical protein [Pilimelia sp.]